jgi:pyruvate dehydrogenase phosphatase
MERGFLESAGRNVFVISGCLICLIWRGTLYAANVGDSRAILGYQKGICPFKRLVVKQMVKDHNIDN